MLHDTSLRSRLLAALDPDDARIVAPALREGIRFKAIWPPSAAPEDWLTWFGGRPCLPVHQTWPESHGVPLTFLGQIDLEALPPAPLTDALPKTGLLSIFMTLDETRGLYPHRPDDFRLLWFPERSAVAPCVTAPDVMVFPTHVVRPVPFLSVDPPMPGRNEPNRERRDRAKKIVLNLIGIKHESGIQSQFDDVGLPRSVLEAQTAIADATRSAEERGRLDWMADLERLMAAVEPLDPYADLDAGLRRHIAETLRGAWISWDALRASLGYRLLLGGAAVTPEEIDAWRGIHDRLQAHEMNGAPRVDDAEVGAGCIELLRIGADAVTGWQWGDGGWLSIFIRPDDLAARRFDRAGFHVHSH